jgi:hypothetical protein
MRKEGTTTITTITPHGLPAGTKVVIAGVTDTSFNGQFTIVSVTSTTLTYAQANLPNLTSGNGTAASTLTQPAQFSFDAAQLSFDLAGSTPRQDSFFNHFPLTVAGFTQARQGTSPEGLGYMGLQSPLTQSSLDYPWFSLNFNLNLGSPGALAAQAGFVASLAVAWSPNTGTGLTDYTVFTGLKLPGSSGSKRAITIEGIFDITFKTLEIIALPDTNTFILVLYNIGFKFLSITFPPTGQVNFVLFGDPSAGGVGTNLGWYAAYAKPATQGSGGSSKSGLLARPSTSALTENSRGGR